MKVAKPSLKLCPESVNPLLMSIDMRTKREDIKANRIPSRIWLPSIAALKCGNRHLKVTEVKACHRVLIWQCSDNNSWAIYRLRYKSLWQQSESLRPPFAIWTKKCKWRVTSERKRRRYWRIGRMRRLSMASKSSLKLKMMIRYQPYSKFNRSIRIWGTKRMTMRGRDNPISRKPQARWPEAMLHKA